MAGDATQHLPEAIATGVGGFIAVIARRHLVSLVADDEVPIGTFQLGLELIVATELVQAIVVQRGMSWEAFEEMRARTREERGGFAERLLLEPVLTSDEGNPR